MKLFREYDLESMLVNNTNKAKDRIKSLSNEQLLGNDIEILSTNYYEEFHFDNLTIYNEDATKRKIDLGQIEVLADPMYAQMYNSRFVTIEGYKVTLYVPYTGDKKLFYCQGNVYSLSGYPDVSINDKYIVFNYNFRLSELANNPNEVINRSFIPEYTRVVEGANRIIKEIDKYNSNFKNNIEAFIKERKSKIEKLYEIRQSMEIPIERNNLTDHYIKLPRKILPISNTLNTQDDYCINDRDYYDILSIIRNIGSTFERTPKSFNIHAEEELRDFILASLNGLFKGHANGEAFRGKGKTDICIEFNNRAAFIAECKIWHGVSTINEDLKQLDGYLTWRDTKCALIYFSKNKDYNAVLDKIADRINCDTIFISNEKIDRNEFSCDFASSSNIGQKIRVRILLFNIYA